MSNATQFVVACLNFGSGWSSFELITALMTTMYSPDDQVTIAGTLQAQPNNAVDKSHCQKHAVFTRLTLEHLLPPWP